MESRNNAIRNAGGNYSIFRRRSLNESVPFVILRNSSRILIHILLTVYKRVLHDELTFEEHSEYMVFDDCTKSFLRGMLQREPLLRMTDARIKAHPYFAMIDWVSVLSTIFGLSRNVLRYFDPSRSLTSITNDMFLPSFRSSILTILLIPLNSTTCSYR